MVSSLENCVKITRIYSSKFEANIRYVWPHTCFLLASTVNTVPKLLVAVLAHKPATGKKNHLNDLSTPRRQLMMIFPFSLSLFVPQGISVPPPLLSSPFPLLCPLNLIHGHFFLLLFPRFGCVCCNVGTPCN